VAALDTDSPDRRGELLDLTTDYVLKHGIADLSLRPLAAAVGSSPRVLLYYFESKEGIISAVIDRLRDRQRFAFASLPRNPVTFADGARAAWRVISEAKNEPLFRLFIEIYGLALQDRKRYGRFLREAVEDWLAYIEAPSLRDGCDPGEARALATVVLAGYRGFLLDLCATRDRARLERAVELWILALDAMPEPRKLADAT
jgi:AcrR family transcriptional regulator